VVPGGDAVAGAEPVVAGAIGFDACGDGVGISAAAPPDVAIFGVAGFCSDCEPGVFIMWSCRALRVQAGVSPESERTYATIIHTCGVGILPPHDGIPFGRPSTIVW
jgi:hypothetical protein